MIVYPHREKLLAAIQNRKAAGDVELLQEAYRAYEQWKALMQSLTETGETRVRRLVELLNQYKDYLEVELIAKHGSDFLKRQKGQMKLDNSVIEEFLPYLVDNRILRNLPIGFELETGSQTSFMSLAFCPTSIHELDKPQVVIKEKDQDFTIGKSL